MIKVGEFTATPNVKCINNVSHREVYVIKHKNKEFVTIYGIHDSNTRDKILKNLELLSKDKNWRDTIKQMYTDDEIYKKQDIEGGINELNEILEKYGIEKIEKFCEEKRIKKIKNQIHKINKLGF